MLFPTGVKKYTTAAMTSKRTTTPAMMMPVLRTGGFSGTGGN